MVPQVHKRPKTKVTNAPRSNTPQYGHHAPIHSDKNIYKIVE